MAEAYLSEHKSPLLLDWEKVCTTRGVMTDELDDETMTFFIVPFFKLSWQIIVYHKSFPYRFIPYHDLPCRVVP